MNTQADYFDDITHRYTNVLDPGFAQQLEMEDLAKALGTIPGKRIMDFGAGMGRITLYFLKRGYNVTAVDVSKKSLDDLYNIYLKNKKGSWGTLSVSPKIPNTRFDAIVGADILHHIAIPQYLPRFYTALNPGGSIAFSEPNALHLLWYFHYFFSGIPWKVEQGITQCTRKNILYELSRARFSDSSIVEHGLFPTTPLSFSHTLCRFNAQVLGKIPLVNIFAFRFIITGKKQS